MFILTMIECRKNFHHKHRTSFHHHHQHHLKHRHRLFYDTLKFKYRSDNNLYFREHFHDFDLIDPQNYRDEEVEALDNESHHIRHHPEQEVHWPVKKEAIVEGDIILGGLMMVHEREDTVTCGPVMPQGGIQALEAMLYTLDMLNHDLKLLPNISLGAHILDDCDKDTYGLEMAVDFIKGEFFKTLFM